MLTILMIDDDTSLRAAFCAFFKPPEFQVATAGAAPEALRLLREVHPDCVILDIDLPGKNGYEICGHIRESSCVPIIFLSNYLLPENKISGFLAGGDDYVTKPCSFEELRLRILARTQTRQQAVKERILVYTALVLNIGSRQAFLEHRDLQLTPIEFRILTFLAENQPNAFSHGEIYRAIWEQPDLGNIHAVQVQVSRLRQKLNAAYPRHAFIQTVWGQGYRFVSPELG